MSPKSSPRVPLILAMALVVLFNLGWQPAGISEAAAAASPEERGSGEGDDEPFVPEFIVENLDGLIAFTRSGKVPILIASSGSDPCRDRKIERGFGSTTICYASMDCSDEVTWEAQSLSTLREGDILVIRQKPATPDSCFAATEWTISGPPWRVYSGSPVPSCDPDRRPWPQVYWPYEIYLYNSCSDDPTDIHDPSHEVSYRDPLVIIDP